MVLDVLAKRRTAISRSSIENASPAYPKMQATGNVGTVRQGAGSVFTHVKSNPHGLPAHDNCNPSGAAAPS